MVICENFLLKIIFQILGTKVRLGNQDVNKTELAAVHEILLQMFLLFTDFYM